jgi:hypothetical protein
MEFLFQERNGVKEVWVSLSANFMKLEMLHFYVVGFLFGYVIKKIFLAISSDLQRKRFSESV